MKITVLDAATLGDDLDLSLFEKFGELTVYSSTSPDEVSEHIGDSDIVILNKIKVSESNLSVCKNLRLICITATGYDNIDTAYCKSRGIAVCNVVGYSTMSVSQITLSMALGLMSHIGEYTRAVANGSYSDGGVANMLTPVFNEICGKTWGIVGYGNIGRQVGRVAEALGCKIIVNKRQAEDGVECVDIDTLCERADIISVHTPLTDSTRGLISRERISKMKKNAILINVARGAVCDEKALADAILEGKIAGLGVDVYTKEPFLHDHPYSEIKHLDNVYLTPHMAWGAYEARVRCCEEVAENIKSFLCGEKRSRIV